MVHVRSKSRQEGLAIPESNPLFEAAPLEMLARYLASLAMTAIAAVIAIGVAFDPNERPAAPDVLIDVVSNVLALTLDLKYVVAGKKPAGIDTPITGQNIRVDGGLTRSV